MRHLRTGSGAERPAAGARVAVNARTSREEAEAENYRKMIVSMAEDIRVIVIKLADRLHNMRTLSFLGKQKQIQKAKETLEVYAPLAHRLGIHSIKWELEDLAFETLHPRKYAEIESMVNERRADRERFVSEAGETLMGELQGVGIGAAISGRAKHFYSIYEKMTRRGKEFNEIFDLTAMRVLVTHEKSVEATGSDYSFNVGVKLRTHKALYLSGGSCRHVFAEDGSGEVRFGCGVDCDGGGIAVALAKDGDQVTVSLQRLRIWRKGQDEDDATPELEAGADDAAFRLERVSLKQCDGLVEHQDVAALGQR